MADVLGCQVAPLLVFNDDWGRHPSSCQHLVGHLLERYDVLWGNTIGTRRPRPDLATLSRGWEKVRQWASPSRPGSADSSPRTIRPRPRVISPLMWPSFGSWLERRINRELLVQQLIPWIAELAEPPIAVTTVPLVVELVDRLPVRRWVYYCVDDFAEWPGLDGATLRVMEDVLIRRADVLIAVSPVLQGKLKRHGRSAHLLTHGVDLDHWVQSEGPAMGMCPCLPDGLEHPLIVFWGVVDRRMDVAFVERLALELTRGTIVLVGPESDPDPALKRLPRVVRCGAVPYEQLPEIARAAEVLIMPYADMTVTRAMQPLKLKEYLATGKPVVVRDLPSTRPWADALDLAETPEAFSQAVRQRLAAGLPEPQHLARARLAQESWAAKALTFEHWLLGDIATSLRDVDPSDLIEVCP